MALSPVVALLVVLVALSDGARVRSGVVVYGLGLCSMLAVSATYHRWVQTVRARALWRRADHATIYAAIAGTFTPICLVAVPGAGAAWALAAVWGLAAAGAWVELSTGRHGGRIGWVLYLGVGWGGLALVPAIWHHAGGVPVLLLFLGGVAYSAGACCFALRWPRLRPAVFSYHEVWHSFTLVAAGCHLAAVWLVVM